MKKIAVECGEMEIESRQEAVERARANLALEGIELTPEALADAVLYISGQADIEDLIARVIKRARGNTVKKRPAKCDVAEIERRRKAHVEARALCAFESIAFTPEMEADAEQNIVGEISDKDFSAYVVRKYGR